MSRGVKIGLIVGVIALGVGGFVAAAVVKNKHKAVEVRMDTVSRRDLVAAVTASGKIDAEKTVDVTADITGRILKLAVKEGDVVKKGQFLVQIDPVQFEGAVSRGEALLASNEAALVQARTNRDQTKRQLDRAMQIHSTAPELIATEAVEQAQQAYDVAVSTFAANQAQVQEARASLQEARDNLARTRLYAPISGRVVRLPVHEGEVAVPGTFSKETALLMTIADLSTILAKVQVDETDVVRLHLGDSVAVSIDAYPDTTFLGRVTKISNSAKLSQTAAAAQTGTNDRAVDFDVEVTLQNPPADVRPDLSCTARIVTDTRKNVLSIPIIALTVREHEKVPNEDLAPQDTIRAVKKFKKKETEGVFVVRDGLATFRPVKIGIAGDEYFEVVDGVREGETIVGGTYQAIRDLKDGDRVKPAPEKKKTGATAS
ncbi:MAG TPA: efflux RND transporter periplasmic adaptor subunit [Gemmatimonadales bacterium]|jgi:HlyD family secretion protein|nr:efflux RND transporter periplasmic adaptor subunit [Gemmatimonadales bacterium]